MADSRERNKKKRDEAVNSDAKGFKWPVPETGGTPKRIKANAPPGGNKTPGAKKKKKK